MFGIRHHSVQDAGPEPLKTHKTGMVKGRGTLWTTRIRSLKIGGSEVDDMCN